MVRLFSRDRLQSKHKSAEALPRVIAVTAATTLALTLAICLPFNPVTQPQLSTKCTLSNASFAWPVCFSNAGVSSVAMPSRRASIKRNQLALACTQHTLSKDVVASADVEQIAITFASMPPGKVFIKHVEAEGWGAEQGFQVGTELALVNDQIVANMSKDEFKRVMRSRPLRAQLSIDKRELQREMTLTLSASSLLNLIGPWVCHPHFDAVHMSSAFHRLGVQNSDFTADLAQSPTFKMLINRTRDVIHNNGMEARGVSNILWAIGKLASHAHHFQDLFAGLIVAVRMHHGLMKQQEISNVFWAIGYLRSVTSDFFELVPTIVEHLMNDADSMREQDIANNMYAAAVLKRAAPSVQELMPLLVQVARRESHHLVTPQALATIGWGLTASGLEDDVLLNTLANRAIEQAPKWNTRDLVYNLVQIIFTLSKFARRHDQLLAIAADRLPRHVHELTNWGLCSLVWSYIKLDPDNSYDQFRQSLVVEVKRRGFDSQSVIRAKEGPEEW